MRRLRYRRLSHRYVVAIRQTAAWLLVPRRGEIPGFGFGRSHWRPDADVCETAGAIDVVVDLAGVEEDAIDVQLFDDALVVEGERHLPACEAGAVYLSAALLQGPFRLELPLPVAVDPSGVEARYERGLLRIKLRKQGVAG
jgi:HSP20 family protein